MFPEVPVSINTGKPSYWTNLRAQVGSHMMTTLHMSHLTFIVLGGLIPRGEQGFSGRKFRLPELHINHKLYHDIGLPWTSCFIRSTRVGNISHLSFFQGWRRRCVKWAPRCSLPDEPSCTIMVTLTAARMYTRIHFLQHWPHIGLGVQVEGTHLLSSNDITITPMTRTW